MKCQQCGTDNIFKKKMCQLDNCPSKASPINKEPEPETTADTPDEIFTEFAEQLAEAEYYEESPIAEMPERRSRKLRLPGGKVIELNSQQDEALDKLEDWVRNPSDLFFVLSGYAGTGKTTIAKEAIRYFASRNPYGTSSVGVSAPTHKAKKVIADSTNLEAATLQSLLGLGPNTDLADFNINKPEFAQKKKPSIEYYKLIVLDEFSMVNKDLWDMLKKLSVRFNVKILAMGDPAQLPPVKEDIAYGFIDPEVIGKFELTKVERQAGDNPLMLIYDAIRNNLTVSKDQFQIEDKVSVMQRPDWKEGDPREPMVQFGHKFHNNLMSFGREVVTAFRSNDFDYDPNYCKMLCWTNERVIFWNQSIRKTLLTDLSNKSSVTQEIMIHAQTLMPNELLMAYKSYNDGILNAAEYEVISMQYSSKKVYYGEKKEFETEFNGYRVALRDVDAHTILNTFILDPDIEEMSKFTKVMNSYLFLAKTQKQWPAYYAFKGETLLIKDIRDNRGTLICGKDLDYAYALTVHKSQGSTYDQVFIDLDDINKNRTVVERNKLKYVAFSRPRYLATVLTGGGQK